MPGRNRQDRIAKCASPGRKAEASSVFQLVFEQVFCTLAHSEQRTPSPILPHVDSFASKEEDSCWWTWEALSVVGPGLSADW